VQAKQQQQQQDTILVQKSLYGAAIYQPDRKGVQGEAPQAQTTQSAYHPLPFGVRSFLDSGNRKPFPGNSYFCFVLHARFCAAFSSNDPRFRGVKGHTAGLRGPVK
jgi:hypothetical protein